MGPRPGNGGTRPGAGRKPTREKHAPKVNQAERKLAANLPTLAELQLALAQGQITLNCEDPASYVALSEEIKAGVLRFGILCATEDPDAAAELRAHELTLSILTACGIVPGTVIYSRPPDRRAIEYCMNRIMGTPTQTVELEWSQEKVESLYSAVCNRAAEVIDEYLDPEVANAARTILFERIAEDIRGFAS